LKQYSLTIHHLTFIPHIPGLILTTCFNFFVAKETSLAAMISDTTATPETLLSSLPFDRVLTRSALVSQL
jgi:hypothetical protein